ncbi:MAG: LPXTG cell wall anchor domain-containing protein [Motilibacteraceae bacterium]
MRRRRRPGPTPGSQQVPSARRRGNGLVAVLVTFLAAVAGVGLIAGPASAHTPSVTTGCAADGSFLEVSLDTYTAGVTNTVKVVVDGKTVDQDGDFGTTFSGRYDLSAAATHTYAVTYTAGDDPDGSHGWSGQASGTIQACLVAPASPSVSAGVCVNGQGQPGYLSEPADTATVSYSLSEDRSTLTATTAAGYFFSSADQPWVIAQDGRSATYHVDVDAAPTDCAQPLTTPTVTRGACVNGVGVAGAITAPADTAGVKYSLNQDKSTLTATLKDGYVFGQVATGWTVADNGRSATYQAGVAAPTGCSGGSTPPPVVVSPSDLGLVKTVDKAEAAPGDTLAYGLVATVATGANNGTAAQTAVVISDKAPTGTSLKAGSVTCTVVPAEVGCTTATTGDAVTARADGALSVGDTLELDFAVTVDDPAKAADGADLTEIDNTGTVASDSVSTTPSNTVVTELTDVEGVVVEAPTPAQPTTEHPVVPAPVTVVAGDVAPAAVQGATLPHTGAGSGWLVALTGLLLTLAGAGLVLTARRRTAR